MELCATLWPMQSEPSYRAPSIPPIVRIIISQATRRRAQGAITQGIFDEQIRRISREELEPRGLNLLLRELPGGCTRFVIKSRREGVVWALMDFTADGTPVHGSAHRPGDSATRVAEEEWALNARTEFSANS
jgi:hypothetical protein